MEFAGGRGKVTILGCLGGDKKKGDDVDLRGGLGYVRGVWEKVRDGSDYGFGRFGSGLKRRAVIGGIYCGWNLLCAP